LTETGGNPNLFIRPDSAEAIVLDHNLAFDGHFDIAHNRQWHLARNTWDLGDLLLRHTYIEPMEHAMAQLHGFEAYLPDAWLEADSLTVALAVGRLAQFRSEEFWRTLVS
jgi:hypothetical protein